MTKILDCTTRDGGHENNWEFDEKYVKNLIEFLNFSNITYYEIGYRNHYDNTGKGAFYNCTPEFLEQYYKIKGNLKLGVMTDTKRYHSGDFNGAEKDYIDFIRIACHPDRIADTLQIAEDLHNKNYNVFVQLMDISNVDESGYLTLFNWQHKEILESLYFADSYGKLQPSDIEKYYNKLKILGFKKISFHGHNNIGKALENSLQAINLGAYSVDVTFDGLGRCGGNLDSKVLLKTIQ